MNKFVLALALIGCNNALSDNDFDPECQVYDEEYSHTVLFCPDDDAQSVEDVFQVCNHRHRADNQIDGCTPNFDLMEFDDDCSVRHFCWRRD